jgi:hypothetical protein
MLLEIAHNVSIRVIGAALNDQVNVIGHDDESVQLEPSPQAHTIQRIDKQALGNVALKEG